MQWDDWNSGDLLLFNDFVAPFGHTREILKDLRNLEWPHKTAFSLRRAQDGSVKKVNHW
jgi:cytolysin-activating lysine-acyltransferase